MTFDLTLPAAVATWQLSGPAGADMDTLVSALVGAGVEVEAITPTRVYRLTGGPFDLLPALAGELAAFEGWALGYEQPPTTPQARAELQPRRTPRRSVVLHGTQAGGYVARAIDRGLLVSTVGLSRWRVAGPGVALLNWLTSEVHRLPDADVLAMYGWSARALAADDEPARLSVDVNLPDRKTVNKIERDANKDMQSVIGLQTTIEQALTP